MDTCKTCRYYLPFIEPGGPVHTDRQLGIGACRRYPPVMHRESNSLAEAIFAFPEVAEGEWCGEFDRKREERDDED